jgi:hypothetical protein
LSAPFAKQTGQDYNILLHTVVTDTWGAAASCLCKEQFHIIRILENILRKIP